MCCFLRHVCHLALSPPAVKTQWLSQCQAFQRRVRSSHTLVNWTFDLLNRFSIRLACFLKTLNALCVCLQYKHPRSMKRVIRSDKPVTLLLLFWSHKCDIGAEPRSRIIATSAVKGTERDTDYHSLLQQNCKFPPLDGLSTKRCQLCLCPSNFLLLVETDKPLSPYLRTKKAGVVCLTSLNIVCE
jgi:hypothetical protein